MAEITKITITKNPGYGCCSYMFQEKITLTANSIDYKLIPHINNKRDAKKHWKYQSNSDLAKGLLQEAFEELGEIAFIEEDTVCYDIGSIEFEILYLDKTKLKKKFWRPPTDFRSGLLLVRDLVPHLEKMPRVLENL